MKTNNKIYFITDLSAFENICDATEHEVLFGTAIFHAEKEIGNLIKMQELKAFYIKARFNEI